MTDKHEESLRRVLHDEASDIEVTSGAWERIEFRSTRARRRARLSSRAVVAMGTAAALLVGVVAVAALTGGDGTDVQAGPAERPVTTVSGPAPTGTGTEDPAGPGIYPFRTAAESEAVSTDQWNDPVFTAERFLRDYAGFTRLTMGEFAQGDSRSGEVTATTRKNGPVTTVLVRQLGRNGGPWTVVGATTPNIVLERPTAMEEVASPLNIQGSSTAFEGNVVIEVREDGQREADGELGLEPLIGGSMGEMGPLTGKVPFDPPGTTGGAVLAYTDSAMDGAREEASVVRVLFAGQGEPKAEPRLIAYDETTKDVVALGEDGKAAKVLGNFSELFDPDSTFGGMAVAPDRTAVFLSALPHNRGPCNARVARINTDGRPTDAPPFDGRSPAVSSDGRQLATATDEDCDGLDELTVRDLVTNEFRRFRDLDVTGTDLVISHLSWAPDGRSVAYEVETEEGRNVQVHDITKSGTPTGDARRIEPDNTTTSWLRPLIRPSGLMQVAVAEGNSEPTALLTIDPQVGEPIRDDVTGRPTEPDEIGFAIDSMVFDGERLLMISDGSILLNLKPLAQGRYAAVG